MAEVSQKRILIVDDEVDLSRLMKLSLETAGEFQVECESNPQNALGVAHEFNPDLMILDLVMPGMDGYEALKQLQLIKDTKDIPVIAISANSMTGDLNKGLKAGFIEYLTKPINIKEFTEKLNTTIARIQK